MHAWAMWCESEVCVCDVCGMGVYVREVCVVCVVWCVAAPVLLPFCPAQPIV